MAFWETVARNWLTPIRTGVAETSPRDSCAADAGGKPSSVQGQHVSGCCEHPPGRAPALDSAASAPSVPPRAGHTAPRLAKQQDRQGSLPRPQCCPAVPEPTTPQGRTRDVVLSILEGSWLPGRTAGAEPQTLEGHAGPRGCPSYTPWKRLGRLWAGVHPVGHAGAHDHERGDSTPSQGEDKAECASSSLALCNEPRLLRAMSSLCGETTMVKGHQVTSPWWADWGSLPEEGRKRRHGFREGDSWGKALAVAPPAPV